MSHDGCSGSFEDGKMVVNKVRQMGFSNQLMPGSFQMPCSGCGKEFLMQTFEAECPDCKMVHGVTPCHAFGSEHVKGAGIGY